MNDLHTRNIIFKTFQPTCFLVYYIPCASCYGNKFFAAMARINLKIWRPMPTLNWFRYSLIRYLYEFSSTRAWFRSWKYTHFCNNYIHLLTGCCTISFENIFDEIWFFRDLFRFSVEDDYRLKLFIKILYEIYD